MIVPRGTSVSRQLASALSSVLAASLLLVVLGVVGITWSQQHRAMANESEATLTRLSAMLAPALWDLDLDNAKAIAQALLDDQRVATIVIRESGTREPIRVGDSAAADTFQLRRDVMRGDRVVGEVTVSFDKAPYREHILDSLLIAVAVSLFAMLAALAAMRVLLRRMLAVPLAQLGEVAERFAAGNYSVVGLPVGTGELRTLSEVMQGLGRKVTAQLDELRTTNQKLASEATARLDAAAALRLRSAALQAAANAVLIADRDGHIIWVNEAFTKLTGFGLADAQGRVPGELLRSGRHSRAFYEHMWKTILEHEVWRGEVMNRRRDGSLFTADMTITPIADEKGRITHFIAVQQDITERKSLEEQFQQAQKMESIGRLAGGVAHDFNNMLSVILGNVELALLQIDPSHPVHADLEEIHKASRRSADLTRQLLAFARKQPVTPTLVDLSEIVGNSLKMLRRLIGEHVSLEWRPSIHDALVYVDSTQIDQVLANLCVNARDAIDDVGTITLSVDVVILDEAACAGHENARPGPYVKLAVSDTGSGMDPEIQAHIFEPFFTTKRLGEGTGLGLAMVYGIVAQNGGFLTVSSMAGEGSTFTVYLPHHEERPRSVGPTDATAVPRGSETILLVEDEPMILSLATRVLEGYGYTVLSAQGPGEALGIVESGVGRIDLLFTDLIMPGMNGKELAKAVRALRPAVKVLYMSGFSGATLSAHGVVDTDAHFIAKPFSPDGLAQKVRALLDAGPEQTGMRAT